VIGEPFGEGVLKAIAAPVNPEGEALVMVGAPGTPTGVTELEAAEAALFPLLLVAFTVKV
jgi:hypothetical protein